MSPARRLDRAEQRRQLGVLRELGLLARADRSRCSARARFEPLAVDADTVFRGQLDGQIERKSVRVVEAEGEVAGQPGRVGGKLFGTARDDPLGVGQQLGERRLKLTGPGIERPRELGLLAGDGRQDLVSPLDEVWVRLAHHVDDDGSGLGHERFAPAKQPAVAHGAPQDAAQDVAPALVRRQHVVTDEERHGPRMVGDDLVAEPLALEGVRIVAEELAHAGVDRQEQVRVVVRRDLLKHAGETLEPHPGVDARERQRIPTVRPLVELHEDEIPDLEPARAVLASGPGCTPDPRRGASPRS